MTSLARASVEVQYGVSFSPGIGGSAAVAPVAIRQRSNDTVRSPPAVSVTVSVWLPVKRASPSRTLMFGLVSRMFSYLAWRNSSTFQCFTGDEDSIRVDINMGAYEERDVGDDEIPAPFSFALQPAANGYRT